MRIFELLKLSMVRRTIVNKGTGHERVLFCNSDISTLQMEEVEMEENGCGILLQKDFINFSVKLQYL